MELEKYLLGLLSQIRGGMEPFLSYDEVCDLPAEQFEEMQRMKVLVETSPAKYYTCKECPDEDCGLISLTIDTDRQTGKKMGFFLCLKGGGGLKKVDLEQLRRWEILPNKIEAYLAPVGDKLANLHEDAKNDTDKEGDPVADWGRQEDKTRVCKWLRENWIKRGKPMKAGVIRDALEYFGLPEDYYGRVRKEFNKRFGG